MPEGRSGSAKRPETTSSAGIRRPCHGHHDRALNDYLRGPPRLVYVGLGQGGPQVRVIAVEIGTGQEEFRLCDTRHIDQPQEAG